MSTERDSDAPREAPSRTSDYLQVGPPWTGPTGVITTSTTTWCPQCNEKNKQIGELEHERDGLLKKVEDLENEIEDREEAHAKQELRVVLGYLVAIHQPPRGSWIAHCSTVHCVVEKDTFDDALVAIRDSIEDVLSVLRDNGMPVPEKDVQSPDGLDASCDVTNYCSRCEELAAETELAKGNARSCLTKAIETRQCLDSIIERVWGLGCPANITCPLRLGEARVRDPRICKPCWRGAHGGAGPTIDPSSLPGGECTVPMESSARNKESFSCPDCVFGTDLNESDHVCDLTLSDRSLCVANISHWASSTCTMEAEFEKTLARNERLKELIRALAVDLRVDSKISEDRAKMLDDRSMSVAGELLKIERGM